MDDIAATLNALSLWQMVLGWAFFGCYALAAGGMLEARGSRRAAGVAIVSALLFCVLAENWVHAALLVMFAIGGMGLFVAAAWMLARITTWFIQRGEPVPAPAPKPPRRTRPQPIGVMLRALWRSMA